MSHYRAILTTLTGLTLVLLLGGCKAGEDASDTDSAVAEAEAQSETSDLAAANDIVSHNGVRFALIDCEVIAANATAIMTRAATGIDGTCEFARQSDESLQLYVLDDSTYALVVASTPRDDDDFCDTTVRAVRLDADRLRVSVEEQNVRMCTSGPFDEQMIATLSDSVPSD